MDWIFQIPIYIQYKSNKMHLTYNSYLFLLDQLDLDFFSNQI